MSRIVFRRDRRFQIVHAALKSQSGAPLPTYREQEVGVALGPMGILEDCNVGTLTRRIEAEQYGPFSCFQRVENNICLRPCYPSSTSRTFLAKASGPNGFERNGIPAIKMKDSCTALAVYPLMKITLRSALVLCISS